MNYSWLDSLLQASGELLAAGLAFLLYSRFKVFTIENYPLKVDKDEAMRKYGSAKWDYLCIIPMFVFLPITSFLIGYALMFIKTFIPPNTTSALFTLYTDDTFYYMIGSLISLGFMLQMFDWFYELVIGKKGYEMYCVAYGIRFDTNVFAMRAKSHYFTIFMLILAFIFTFLFENISLKAYDKHIEVCSFASFSPKIWHYSDIDSIQYGTNLGYYKIKCKNNDYLVTGWYNENPPENITNTTLFIAKKANIKIDTVAKYYN